MSLRRFIREDRPLGGGDPEGSPAGYHALPGLRDGCASQADTDPGPGSERDGSASTDRYTTLRAALANIPGCFYNSYRLDVRRP